MKITGLSFQEITNDPLYKRMLPHSLEMIVGVRNLSNHGVFSKEVLG